MTYNGTSNGLNGVQWGNHFILPILLTQVQAEKDSIHMADIDIGKKYLTLWCTNPNGYIVGWTLKQGGWMGSKYNC